MLIKPSISVKVTLSGGWLRRRCDCLTPRIGSGYKLSLFSVSYRLAIACFFLIPFTSYLAKFVNA